MGITVVGDDDQSIYSFRGAQPGVFRAFHRHTPHTPEPTRTRHAHATHTPRTHHAHATHTPAPTPAPAAAASLLAEPLCPPLCLSTRHLGIGRHVANVGYVTLSQNYRSSKNIVDAATAVIKPNPHRIDKQVFTAAAAGAKVELCECRNAALEADWVVTRLLELQAEGTPLSSVAILYRTHAVGREIYKALKDKSIPRAASSADVFARPDVAPLVNVRGRRGPLFAAQPLLSPLALPLASPPSTRPPPLAPLHSPPASAAELPLPPLSFRRSVPPLPSASPLPPMLRPSAPLSSSPASPPSAPLASSPALPLPSQVLRLLTNTNDDAAFRLVATGARPPFDGQLLDVLATEALKTHTSLFQAARSLHSQASGFFGGGAPSPQVGAPSPYSARPASSARAAAALDEQARQTIHAFLLKVDELITAARREPPGALLQTIIRSGVQSALNAAMPPHGAKLLAEELNAAVPHAPAEPERLHLPPPMTPAPPTPVEMAASQWAASTPAAGGGGFGGGGFGGGGSQPAGGAAARMPPPPRADRLSALRTFLEHQAMSEIEQGGAGRDGKQGVSMSTIHGAKVRCISPHLPPSMAFADLRRVTSAPRAASGPSCSSRASTRTCCRSPTAGTTTAAAAAAPPPSTRKRSAASYMSR